MSDRSSQREFFVFTATRLASPRIGFIKIAILGFAAGVIYPEIGHADVSFTGDVSFTSPVMVGVTGYGTIRIDDGSDFSSNSLIVGNQQTAAGIATVTGRGSQWTLTGGVAEIGASGIGRLEILDGGVFTTTQSGQIRIAVNGSSLGTVVVDGPGSLLTAFNLTFGINSSSSGIGLLRISNGAIASIINGRMDITTRSRVEVSDGLLRIGQLNNSGVISGSGDIVVQNSSGPTINRGRVEAGNGDYLRISAPNFDNIGIIEADGGEIEFMLSLENVTSSLNAGQITLRNGVVRAGSIEPLVPQPIFPQLMNLATLAAIGGVNDFYGSITNSGNGRIAVTNQSVMIFHDDVTADDGTITVFPGSSAIFLEDLTINSNATLIADLAGTMDETGFGQVQVVGNAQLAGNLAVTLANGYVPQAGDEFLLVSASRIDGSLSLGAMPALSAGLSWSLGGDANHVVLSVVPTLDGDYNANGVVDAADYVLWRKMLNESGGALAADGDGNGSVGSEDYDYWRARFGNSAGGAAASDAAIPEPATAASFLLGLALVYSSRRKLN